MCTMKLSIALNVFARCMRKLLLSTDKVYCDGLLALLAAKHRVYEAQRHWPDGIAYYDFKLKY